MMNGLPDTDDFARGSLPTSDLDALLDRIGASALPLSGAAACLIDLAAEVVGPRPVRMAAPLEGALADSLRQLIGGEVDIASGPRCARLCEHDVGGRRHRFLFASLGGPRGPRLGTVVLGYAAERGGPLDVERRARPFLTMLEALLSERRAKLAMTRDMAVLGRHAAELQRQVQTDALTGLANGRSFKERARDVLNRGREPHALVLLDVDHFKQINDLHGHQFGDIYLSAIAGALQGSVASEALIGRIGGDEFALLLRLPAEAEPALVRVMEVCRRAVAQLSETMGKPELGSISMGAALFPRHGEDYDALFEQADTALYAGKEAGRGSEVIFDPHRHLRFSLRELVRNFSGALAEGEIRPVFHPVVDLATGHCSGYEVLARWQGAGGGVMGPEQFYPIFENGVLAQQLTRSIIAQATQVLRALPVRRSVENALLRIGINVTGFDLHNRTFVEDLGQLLAELDLPWTVVVIEVPETVMLGETGGRAFETLRDLRGRGAKIALDDFGTGYGSLRHLGAWPIDMLKIDRQFVQGLSARPRDRAVVEAILSMARRFGFRVVAEGIETPGQLSYLRAMGCDAGQGHLLSPPIPADALADAPLVYPIGDRLVLGG
ncbi:putative bifunctional diguanylate cyclase/phosphodiesterase [Alloyangia pacifica]|uniref:Diguanylate cyclase/phosphodiesterase n=1 Tax=Alloyangia pacifica TaxID=311180 RepID=A0A1I6P6P3_9RHOB|nr:bifunctional diguanylate cyclase/phosphodiesterase [Alloyangia pacifica]SDG20554.1 diguanylate cyclase/phosphodiesterase [Alloyangia pacifica]SFS35825.1 diguanylate cyclase/phosphodiesterase [Alloyangia pacifica]